MATTHDLDGRESDETSVGWNRRLQPTKVGNNSTHSFFSYGSGQDGLSSQTPEISATEIVSAGITTVVGCLGVDTTMKTMAGLLARAKALKEEGLSAFIWSGGYNVRRQPSPARSATTSCSLKR